MKRILLSLAVMVLAGGSAVAAGSTGAFFSDTQSSVGNTFTAGAIDLKIDNDSFYNGNECKETAPGSGVFTWVGTSPFPIPGTACTTTWNFDNLQNNGVTIHKFFDFQDIKPSDREEDTISLHNTGNDAYLCGSLTLTGNSGTLAQNVNLIVWADDGNNVLETGEPVLYDGSFNALGPIGTPKVFTFADSGSNVWNPGSAPGPFLGGDTKFLAKAWCFGTLTPTPVTPGSGNPVTNPGFTCDGSTLDNSTEGNSMSVDVSFNSVQARNNSGFLCAPRQCTPDPTNLVTNGGFETPIVVNPAKWDIFPSGTAGLGWSVAWRDASPTTFDGENRPTIANIELHRGVLGPAAEGQQYTELDSDWGGPNDPLNVSGEPAATVISQTIATVPGSTYKLHFQFAPRPSTATSENELGVTWGGVAQPTVGPTAGGAGNPAWSPFDYTVTATSTQTQISFTDLGSPNDSEGTFLDDVQVTKICPGN